MDKDLLWSKILEIIKSETNLLLYDTWFSETKLHKFENGIAQIIVPMAIAKKHISTNYKELLTKAIQEVTNTTCEFELLLNEELVEEESLIIETFDNKEETKTTYEIKSNLLSKYTFENFVVGNSNLFAHAAALAVAEAPGTTYNPLFIYGNSGLGKTHLMHAIGNYIVKNSDKKVLYTTSEQFVQEFISMTRKDNKGANFEYVDFFKQKYRNIDVLIIDDIQYLGTATESQKEFFHTFNTLYEGNKQIIISSDSSPDDLKLLEDRLKTRFGWGLVVDIFPPDIELRTGIIRKKIEVEHLPNIPEEVIQYMASTISGSIRHIEGALTRLIAYCATWGSEITLSLAQDALKEFVNKGYVSEKNQVAKIQKIVADHFQISVDDLRGKKRSSNIAFPRQIAMYLCRKLTDESFPKIGSEFGGKDHTTVMHSCDKIEKEIKNNKELAKTIDKLQKDIH